MKLEMCGKIAALMAAGVAYEAGLGKDEGGPLQGSLPPLSCALAEGERAPSAVSSAADKYLRQQPRDFAALMALADRIERSGEAISAAREDTALTARSIQHWLDISRNIAGSVHDTGSQLALSEQAQIEVKQHLLEANRQLVKLQSLNTTNAETLETAYREMVACYWVTYCALAVHTESSLRQTLGRYGCLSAQDRDFYVAQWYVTLALDSVRFPDQDGKSRPELLHGVQALAGHVCGMRPDDPQASIVLQYGNDWRAQIHDSIERANEGPSISAPKDHKPDPIFRSYDPHCPVDPEDLIVGSEDFSDFLKDLVEALSDEPHGLPGKVEKWSKVALRAIRRSTAIGLAINMAQNPLDRDDLDGQRAINNISRQIEIIRFACDYNRELYLDRHRNDHGTNSRQGRGTWDGPRGISGSSQGSGDSEGSAGKEGSSAPSGGGSSGSSSDGHIDMTIHSSGSRGGGSESQEHRPGDGATIFSRNF